MYSNKQLTALAEVSRSVAYNYTNNDALKPKRFEREAHLKIASIVLLQQEAKRHTWHDLFADIMSHGLQNSHSVAFADVMKVSKDDAYHLLYNLTDIFERVGWADVSGIQIEGGLSWFRVNDMPFACIIMMRFYFWSLGR